MGKRQANIGFNDYLTDVASRGNARLVPGSVLSPILFVFLNSDRVDQSVNCIYMHL
jgi:hypothetical protein